MKNVFIVLMRDGQQHGPHGIVNVITDGGWVCIQQNDGSSITFPADLVKSVTSATLEPPKRMAPGLPAQQPSGGSNFEVVTGPAPGPELNQ